MTLNRFALTAALLAAATLASAPASAQERDARKREAARSAQEGGGGNKQDRSGERAQPKRESAAPREEPRRDNGSIRAEKRGDEAVVGRAVPRSGSRRDDYSVREEKRREAERRDYGRTYDRGSYDRDRRSYDRDRGYGYSSRGYAPRTYYRPYVFRPHLSIGFGIFSGYAVPYSYSYSDPIPVYGYRAPRGPVMVGPGSPLYGGVALEIGPYDADVFVDGNYAGRVEDFDGTSQPLTLVAGTHRIEVQAPGYAPLVFDVIVQPGQVIPYRGDLRPY
jgi:hypothetical protein